MKKAPGKSHREGISLEKLFQMFPDCQSAFNDDPLSSSNRDPPPGGGTGGGSRRRRASPRAGPAAAAPPPLSCEILPGGWRRH